MRISQYLEHGEGTWWEEHHGEYKFFDADRDQDHNVLGPKLMHFRSATVQDVYQQRMEKGESIIEGKTILLSPQIRLLKMAYMMDDVIFHTVMTNQNVNLTNN